MDTKKQTAVEWLVDNLTPHYPHIKELKLTIGLAKDMEKEQIVSAYSHGWYDDLGGDAAGDVHYTQTYERNRNNQAL